MSGQHSHNEGSKACTVCRDPPPKPQTSAMSANSADAHTYAYMHSGCPLTRKEVGRAAWAFLHTTAAYFPDSPSRKQQDEMRSFMLLMARVYPCGYCADTTSDEMVRNPPRTASRHELSQWLCEIHNEVNARMNKPLFDCSKVVERWRNGPSDGSCD